MKKHGKKLSLKVTQGVAVLVGTLTSSQASMTALSQLSNHSETLSEMVTGPLGKSIVFIGTLGGFFTAFMKGSIWLAVGVLGVGVALALHIENVIDLFGR